MNVRKILCPIDFSSGSQQAMRVATRLAAENDAELVLFHAWSVPPLAFPADYVVAPSLYQELSDGAQAGLDDAVREVTAQGAKRVSAKLVNGLAWTMVVSELEDASYDLAVVGTHGRTGLARIFLGSVAEKIVRHAPCSVLTVRPDADLRPFLHILCPIDFSDSAQRAANLAGTLIGKGGAGITLLHVIDLPVAYSGEPTAENFLRDLDVHASTLLDSWAERLRASTSAPVTTRSRIGGPGAETLAVLDHDPTIDLVVMGSHGRTGIARALLGSVAEKVVRHARCPVLIARHRP